LIEFYKKIIHTASQNGILYDDEGFMENLKIWFTAMTSSNLRSFRHTSTLVFLTILTELCNLHVSSSQSINQQEKIIEIESQKKRPAKSRLNAAEKALQLSSANQKYLQVMMKDVFDTVFVHRYRDIDPRIRAECIRELGTWMDILPSFFFESQYLRYFGWLLSDIHGATRHEVIKSLAKLYANPNNTIGFRQFTERFRSRLVEMSCLDSDTPVRVATIDLLKTLRDVGFLEEDDIEIVSSLIYDSEPRVRKAVSKFLVSHVAEQVKAAHDEFNANELKKLKNNFSELDDSWIIFKYLASLLKVSQTFDQGNSANAKPDQVDLQDLYPSRSSRTSLAGSSLWEAGFGEQCEWPALVEQLLFDFSSLDSKAKTSSSKRFVEFYAIGSSDSLILLEALYGFVKGSIDAVKRAEGRRAKKITDTDAEELLSKIQEDLITAIPKLLENYSHSPEAVAQVMKLHELLDLNICRPYLIQTGGEGQYTNQLIDLIVKQFKTHKQSVVIEECANVFLKATTSEDALIFADDVRNKITDLFEDVSFALKSVLLTIPERLDTEELDASLDNILEPLTKVDCLSRVVDIRKVMDSPLQDSEEGDSTNGVLLVDKLKRLLSNASMYRPDKNITLLIVSIANLLRSYAMWKLGSLIETATVANATSSSTAANPTTPNNGLDLTAKASDFTTDLIQEFELLVDQSESLHIRSVAAKSLLDLLVTVNVTIAQMSSLATSDAIKRLRLFDLPSTIADSTQREIMGLFLKKEKAYAKTAKIELQTGPNDKAYRHELHAANHAAESQLATQGGVDDDILDDEESDDDEDNDDEDEVLNQTQTDQVLSHDALVTRSQRVSRLQQRLLLLDHDLCQLTAKIRVAGLAKLIDSEHISRLTLNIKHLSPLFGLIVGTNIAAEGQEETGPAEPAPSTTTAAATSATSGATNSTSNRRENQTEAANTERRESNARDEEQLPDAPPSEEDNEDADDEVRVKTTESDSGEPDDDDDDDPQIKKIESDDEDAISDDGIIDDNEDDEDEDETRIKKQEDDE
jgi:cohesin complex subunit SA-1/2